MVGHVSTAMPETDVSGLSRQCRAARDRGRDWILAHLDPHGKPVGAETRQCYYRVPWTLAVVGEQERAATVVAWMERHALTSDGDLAEGAARKGFIERSASYPLAIIGM